jgi:hypothetical protein
MLKEKLKTILEKFEKKQGKNIDLLAILKMDDLIDKWSIVVSAKWINDQNVKQSFNDFVKFIISGLSDEELSTIARLNVMSVDEHLAEELLKFKTGTNIENQKINGNQIYEGYIIFSRS